MLCSWYALDLVGVFTLGLGCVLVGGGSSSFSLGVVLLFLSLVGGVHGGCVLWLLPFISKVTVYGGSK